MVVLSALRLNVVKSLEFNESNATSLKHEIGIKRMGVKMDEKAIFDQHYVKLMHDLLTIITFLCVSIISLLSIFGYYLYIFF